MNILNRNLTALGLVVVAAAPVMAQESTGMIRGSVRTKGGQALAGVTIEFTSPVLMMKRTVVTNERGDFRAPLLPPGDYKIVASKGGFITVPVKGVHLGLGQTLNQEIVLPEEKTGSAVVEVVAAAAMQDKTDVKTGVTMPSDVLETLPGNARGLEQVADLAPGVSTNGGGLLTIRGATALDTKYLLNGTDISDNVFGQYDSRKYFVDDAIQETQVISSPVHAKFGGTSGGIVNAITKSGGNEFEGTLRLNLSCTSWNALRPMGGWRPNEGDASGNKQNRGSDTLNRAWSVHLMGPIVKDRLWFSVSTKLDPPQSANAYMTTTGITRYDAYRGKDLQQWYGDLVPSTPLGSNRVFYTGPSLGAPYTRTSNNQFYEFKLTGAINANHSLTASGSRNTFSTDKRLYGNSADMNALGPQTQSDKYVSLSYRGILASNITLEVMGAKKFLTYGGGGDPAKGDRIRAKDNRGTAWQFNNATFSLANPDDRNIRTINANLSIWSVDFGKLGQHTFDIGAENITRNRRAANLQSPTATTIYSLGSWMNNGVQNFIMRRHEPRIDRTPAQGGYTTMPELLAALAADRDPNWDTMFVKEIGSNSPTETQIYSAYVNDTITLNQNWQFMVGLRYDRTDVADTFGNPTIKNTSFSPRFQVTYDPLGNQRYIFRASWARYTGSLAEGFTNNFSLAGNPISEYYTWKAGNDGDFFTLADIQNRNNWDLTQGGLLWVDNAAVAAKANPDLKCPSNDEISVGFRYNAQDGSYLNVTYAQRKLKNAFDSKMTTDLATQVAGVAPSFPTFSVPMALAYWDNSDMVQHDYKCVEVEWQSRISSAFQIAGNFTYSILKGNGNLDADGNPAASTALNYYKDVQDAMHHTVDMYAPYGNLSDDNRFKSRVWGTYTLGTPGGASLSTTLMMNYDGGTPFALTRDNAFDARDMADANGCGNLGQYPTAYTRYYGGRNAMRTNDTVSFDLKLNLNIPLYKKVVFFSEVSVINVFNHCQLTGLDTTTEFTDFLPDGDPMNGYHAQGLFDRTAVNGGTNVYGFGTYGFGNFTPARSVLVSTGLKW